jgi:hypothetical protein
MVGNDPMSIHTVNVCEVPHLETCLAFPNINKCTHDSV